MVFLSSGDVLATVGVVEVMIGVEVKGTGSFGVVGSEEDLF